MSLNKSLIVRWIIGLGLIGYLLTLIDFSEFFKVLSRGHLGLVGLSVVIVLLDRVWMGAKWKILLTAQNIKVPLYQCVRAYYVASFVGLVLPTSVGSDLIRLMSLPVEKGEREKVAATIVIEKFLAMFALFFLVVLCIFLLVWTSSSPHWNYFFISLSIFFVTVVIFVLSIYFFPHRKLNKLEGKFFQVIAKIGLAYQQFKYYRKAMILFFLVSFLEQLVPFVFSYILAKAFQLPGTAWGYFMVVPLIYIVARIPVSVDAIGVLEGISMLLFPIVGLSKTDSLLLALAGRASTTIGHLIGGIFYFWRKK